jgi:peptidoglycan/LPS O-acetylase OafA/YrhL
LQHRFSALDGLRGAAAISVAVYHFYYSFPGYLAVDFFLVLSGFVLTHKYLYTTANISSREFIWHRLARLYPLHIFTLVTWTCGYVLYIGSFPSFADGTVWTFFQHLTLTQNVGLSPSETSWNTPSWSISVEFWVNLLFFFLISITTRSYLLFAVAVGTLVIIYSQSGDLDVSHENFFLVINSGLLRGIASFFLGIIAYRGYRKCLTLKTSMGAASFIEVALLLAVVATFYFRSSLRSDLDFIAPFLFCILVVVYSLERGIVSSLFCKFKWLGDISYSVYLNHFTVIWLLLYVWVNILELEAEADLVRSPSNFALYLVLVIGYSKFTYWFIEKPAQSFLRKYV